MLVVEEDWEGGVVTKERYFNLWTKLREASTFPQLFILGLSADRSEGTPS